MEPRDVIHFESPAEFRAWLIGHHAQRDEAWVGYWKRSTGRPSMTWEESVDEALCFGWIDGLRKSLDEHAYAIRFTPRRSRSTWSRRNIERYRVLDAAGRIEPAGRSAFEARRSGNPATYSYEQDTPPSLSRAYLERLRSNEAAWADWQSRPEGYRRQVAGWVMSAKRVSTRERRLTALIEDCVAGRKIKPLRF